MSLKTPGHPGYRVGGWNIVEDAKTCRIWYDGKSTDLDKMMAAMVREFDPFQK